MLSRLVASLYLRQLMVSFSAQMCLLPRTRTMANGTLSFKAYLGPNNLIPPVQALVRKRSSFSST
jgi:hypothetical protein